MLLVCESAFRRHHNRGGFGGGLLYLSVQTIASAARSENSLGGQGRLAPALFDAVCAARSFAIVVRSIGAAFGGVAVANAKDRILQMRNCVGRTSN
ncbi:hypothetical protein [Chelatococcus reniformis]|uniref:hypothetical protein n=1 Tax=Chelatococcus reniformis TaxID=1494448 RepID=UPI00166C954D|nr:hypothetical protein [Chelatococcus reniformis]